MQKIWIFTGMIFASFVVLVRIEPEHIPNIVPLGAFALWAGYFLEKRSALFSVLAVLLITDAQLGVYAWQIMAAVYLSTLFFIPIGRAARRVSVRWNRWWITMMAPFFGAGIVGSAAFFLVTNAAVWRWGALYPRTIAGFGACLAAGLPFWRNSAIGDLYGVAIFFGVSAVVSLVAATLDLARVRVG